MPRHVQAPTAVAPISDGVGGSEHAAPYAHLDGAMDRYAQGDDSAFAELHGGLGPRLRKFLLRLTGNPTRAADLSQETFLRIHRARGSFGASRAVVPWAIAIARNVFHDDLRRRREVSTRADDEADDLVARLPSLDGTSEELFLAKEAATVIKATLAAMPVPQREAFVLLRFEGLSLLEAAEVLDATPTAVKLRAFRAYEAIRGALNKRERQ